MLSSDNVRDSSVEMRQAPNTKGWPLDPVSTGAGNPAALDGSPANAFYFNTGLRVTFGKVFAAAADLTTQAV